MMDEQLRDNVELLIRGKREAPSSEFLERMDALLKPREHSAPGRRLVPFAAIAAAAAFAFILWIARHGTQLPVSESQDGTIVKGTISFKGLPPPRQTFGTKGFGPEAEKLYPEGLAFDPIPVDAAGRVRDCLVFVLSGLEGKSFELPKQPKTLSFDRMFLKPRNMGIMVGQELVLENHDNDVHNAHFLPFANKETNDVFYQGGATARRRFTEPERGIKVKCDITHAQEQRKEFHATSWITVLPHPFHAVTDDQGRFEIRGLPPGRYTIEAWQEFCVPALMDIEVKPGQPAEVAVSIEARPPNVNRLWDAVPGDTTWNAWQGKAVEIGALLDIKVGERNVARLKALGKTVICNLAPGVEEQIKGFPPGASVTFRGIFKGRGDSESVHFVMEDCQLSEAPGQKFWK